MSLNFKLTTPNFPKFAVAKRGGDIVVMPDGYHSFSPAALAIIEIKKQYPEKSIVLTFNGVELPITAGSSADDLQRQYEAAAVLQREEYERSPARQEELAKIAAAAARRAEIVERSQYKFTDDMANISSWGGSAEINARESVIVGLELLAQNPTININSKSGLASLQQEIEKYDHTHSGGSMSDVLSAIQTIAEKGWDSYAAASREHAAASRIRT